MNKGTISILAILTIGLLISGCIGTEKADKIGTNGITEKQIEMSVMANNPSENTKSIFIEFELPANAKIESVTLPNNIKISGKELFLYEKTRSIKGAESIQAKIENKGLSGKIGVFWKEPVNGSIPLSKIILSGTEKFPTKVLAQGINDKREKIGLNVEGRRIS